MTYNRCVSLALSWAGAATVMLLSGCALHHVRDEAPAAVLLGKSPATVTVETAPGSRPATEGDSTSDGERLLITVDHPGGVSLEGAVGTELALTGADGRPIDSCHREALPGQTLPDGSVVGGMVGSGEAPLGELPVAEATQQQARPGRTQLLFECRWRLREPVSLRTGAGVVPVLGDGGVEVIGARPWLLSGWVRGELGAHVTGVPSTRTVDLGVNLGLRGLLLRHISIGVRGDVLVDTTAGRGQVLVGPEMGYVHQIWPCARCSIEASLSYLLGYNQGFAEGPEVDARFGYRIARTGTTWHGVEMGMGYRHLIGPESGGSLVFTLSYTQQAALRWGALPASLRAAPNQLQ